MSDKSRHLIRAIVYLLIAVDLASASGYVYLAQISNAGRGDWGLDWSSLAFAILPITAAAIINRQPRNPVGWSLAGLGLLNVFSNCIGEYAQYALVTRPGSLPWGDLAAWFAATWWLATQPLSVSTILLFPNGRPPSRRWWALLWVVFGVSFPLYIYLAVLFWNLRGPRLLTSDIQAAVGPALWPRVSIVVAIWEPVFLGGMALAVIAMAVRFARSRGIERQQLKWIFLAMSITPVSIGLSMVGGQPGNPLIAAAGTALNILSVIAAPVAITFAITRYHLYDIDFIIRRTLLYAALTVSLALVYFGSVLVMQGIFARVDGRQSPVTIVLSTLLIAALASPLRARFQRAIDKRFYRSRYNSEQVLERFSADLRSEVNLDAINHHLLGAVEESLQPDQCVLWLVKH